MVYKEIIQAIRDYSELVEASSQKFNSNVVFGLNENITSADFEETVCNYIDALNEIKRVRNRNKRFCLVYDALGYMERQIAETLRISPQAVSKNLRWLERFFLKVV